MGKRSDTDTNTTKNNFVNSLKLDWPQDPHGLTHKLRVAAVQTIQNVKSDPEKLKLVTQTLAVIQKHKNAVFENEIKMSKIRLQRINESKEEAKQTESRRRLLALELKRKDLLEVEDSIKNLELSLGVNKNKE